MITEPAIGDVSFAPADICAWTEVPGGPFCGAPAHWHFLSESAVYGLVQLTSCDTHAGVARAAGVLHGEHLHGENCRTVGLASHWAGRA